MESSSHSKIHLRDGVMTYGFFGWGKKRGGGEAGCFS